MRQQLAPSFLRLVVLALAFVVIGRTHASADDRGQARTHYQAGVKFYNSGDYRSAIREFSSAQQLVPADLNNYNLALCYDKLGDPEPAIQYYRAYLDKVPNTDKRAEIEASVSRLDAAAKSAAAKKAEEARQAEAARKEIEARKAEDARKAEEARLAEEARKAEEARQAEETRRATDPMLGGTAGIGTGSTGTPTTGLVSTGDAQLDRAQQINVDQIRDQRMGSTMTDPRAPAPGPTAAGMTAGATSPETAGAPPTNAAAPNAGPNAGPTAGPQQDEPKKADPVYKKWWFWAVVAVSAYVVYQIATEDSQPGTRARELPLPMGPASQPGGLTLMRW